MRRGIWVVLGLVGMAPVGALAQQEQGQAARQGSTASGGTGQASSAQAADTAPPIIVEMPASAEPIPSGRAARQSGTCRPGEATGGSGRSPSRAVPAVRAGEEIFVGTVRAVTADRLRLAGPSGRVYEFGLDQRTRIIGPNGEARSIQAVREGAPVRTVTREAGGFENQVVTLQLLGQAPAPAR